MPTTRQVSGSTDVGSPHLPWLARLSQPTRRLGTMGYCVPAAMGAKVGQPDKIVWGIDGDGCFQMTNQSSRRAHWKVPIKIAVINNQSGWSGSGRPCSIKAATPTRTSKPTASPISGNWPRPWGASACAKVLRRRRADLIEAETRSTMFLLWWSSWLERHGLAHGGRRDQQRRHQGRTRHGAGLGRGSVWPVFSSTHILSVLVQNKPGVLASLA